MQYIVVSVTRRKVVRDSVAECLIFLDSVADSGGGGAKIGKCSGGVVRSSKTCAAFFGIKFDKFLHLYFSNTFSEYFFQYVFRIFFP